MKRENAEIGLRLACAGRGLCATIVLLSAALALTVSWHGPAYAKGTEWETYLSEKFDTDESMFYTGKAGEAYYSIDDQGRYIVNGMDTDSDSLSAITDELYYYSLEAKCELVSSDAQNLAFVGLVFHYQKQADNSLGYYVFYIYGDGYYGAKRVIGDQVEIALPLTKSDAIDVGAANVLGVEAQGSRFDLFINGRHVDGFTDMQLDGGGFGFYISKRSEGAFDDFLVKVEQRDMGKDELTPPDAEEGDDGAGANDPNKKFTKYAPPYIPKDPKRPVYPWEVGVDKTGKGKKAKPGDDAEGAGDEDSGKDEQGQDEGSGVKVSTKNTGAGKGQEKPKEPGRGKDRLEQPKDEPVEPETPVEDTSAEQAQETAAPTVAAPKKAPGNNEAGHNGAEGSTKPAPEKAAPPDMPETPVVEPETKVEPELALEPAAEAPAMLPEEEAGAGTEAATPEEPVVADEATVPHEEQAAPPAEPETAPASEPATPKTGSSAPADEAASAGAATPPSPQPKKDLAAEMRKRQDDWSDVNTRADPPQEIRPPQEVKPAPTKEQVPAAEDEGMKVPSAPGTTPEEEAEKVAAQPEPPAEASKAPAAEGTKLDDLALLPVEPATAGQPAPDEPPADDTKEAAAAPQPEPEPAAEPEPAPEVAATPPEAKTPAEVAQPAAEGEKTSIELGEYFPQYQQGGETATPPAKGEGVKVALEPTEDTAALKQPQTDSPAAGAALDPATQPAAAEAGIVELRDDFSEAKWPVAENAECSYRYFGAAYEIDNLKATTMALSFQQQQMLNADVSCDCDFMDGVSYVGYGIASRFSVQDGKPTYYGLFICASGEFMLLKMIGGQETVLAQWEPTELLKANQPNRITLSCWGQTISAQINGEAACSVTDASIPAGGYALLVGPGVASRFDNFSLRGQPVPGV